MMYMQSNVLQLKQGVVVFLDQPLGEGTYGKVYKGRDYRRNIPLAVKRLSIQQGDPVSDKYIQGELDALTRLKHPSIVAFYGSVVKNTNRYFIFEFCEGGDLEHELAIKKKFEAHQVFKILDQLISAMAFANKEGYEHRDIKPANIMLMNDKITVRLVDFGLAKKLQSQNTSMHQTRCGSRVYMAPQVFKSQPYGMKCDVWSLGICVYQLLTGELSWKHLKYEADLGKKIEQFMKSVDLKHQIEEPLRSILEKMLVPESRRAYFSDLQKYIDESRASIMKQLQGDDLTDSLKKSGRYVAVPRTPNSNVAQRASYLVGCLDDWINFLDARKMMFINFHDRISKRNQFVEPLLRLAEDVDFQMIFLGLAALSAALWYSSQIYQICELTPNKEWVVPDKEKKQIVISIKDFSEEGKKLMSQKLAAIKQIITKRLENTYRITHYYTEYLASILAKYPKLASAYAKPFQILRASSHRTLKQIISEPNPEKERRDCEYRFGEILNSRCKILHDDQMTEPALRQYYFAIKLSFIAKLLPRTCYQDCVVVEQFMDDIDAREAKSIPAAIEKIRIQK